MCPLSVSLKANAYVTGRPVFKHGVTYFCKFIVVNITLFCLNLQRLADTADFESGASRY